MTVGGTKEGMFPHHLNLLNKTRLQEILSEVENHKKRLSSLEESQKEPEIPNLEEIAKDIGAENLENILDHIGEKSSEEPEEKEEQVPPSQIFSETEAKLKEFKDCYVEEIDAWKAINEEISGKIENLEGLCQKQAEIIEATQSSLNSEQIKRHKSEHLLKIILKHNPALSQIHIENTVQNKEITTNETAENDLNAEAKNDEVLTRNEKVTNGYQGEISALKIKIKQLTGQLETEQDKITKLQEIITEYHQEKAKEEKQRETLLEQRSQNAPRSIASRHSSAALIKTLGESQDFFEEMFNEPKFLTLSSQMLLGNGFVSSSTGNVRIDNVHQNGGFIVLRNGSFDQNEEIGLFILQQKLNGKVIASFRFPQRAKLKAGSKINIWASSAPEGRNCPPSDYVWKDQYKCVYGLECITVLCKPNGQAVAWYCGQHHYDGNLPELNDLEMLRRQSRLIPMVETQIGESQRKQREFVRREKTEPRLATSYDVRKHPHGLHFHVPSHPSSDQFREKVLGNDQTSLMRHIRLSRTPDTVPELYTGGARTGVKALYRAWEGTPTLVPMKSSAGMIRKISSAQMAQ